MYKKRGLKSLATLGVAIAMVTGMMASTPVYAAEVSPETAEEVVTDVSADAGDVLSDGSDDKQISDEVTVPSQDDLTVTDDKKEETVLSDEEKTDPATTSVGLDVKKDEKSSDDNEALEEENTELLTGSASDGNDTRDTATFVSLDSQFAGKMENSADKDYYKFTVTKPGYVTLTFGHDAITRTDGWKVRLMAGEGETEYFSGYFDNMEGTNITTSKYSLAVGDYYIVVEPESTYWFETVANKEYRVKVNFTDSVSAGWEKENNDSNAYANELSPGSMIKGNLSIVTDKDYYKFTLAEPGYVTLTFGHEAITRQDGWKVRLMAAEGGTEYFSNYFDNMEGTNVTTSKYSLSAGDYYICIEPESTYWFETVANKEYRATINFTDSVGAGWEKENNDSNVYANVLSLGSVVKGNLSILSDKDYYKFTLAEPGYVTLTFGHEAITRQDGWKVKLIAADGGTEYFAWACDTLEGTDVTTSRYSLAKGDYYISVEPESTYWYEVVANKEYRLKADYTSSDTAGWEKENNDSISSPNPIGNALPVAGMLSTNSDKDYYAFVMPGEGRVSFSFEHDEIANTNSSGYWKIKLISATSNKSVAEMQDNGGLGIKQNSQEVTLSAGTYYIVVEKGYYYSNATYKLTLNAPNATATLTNGLKSETDGSWSLYSNGSIATGFTDIYCDPSVGWWLVRNGKVDFGYNGLFCSPTYGWWKIKDGTVDFAYSDLYCDPVYGWWKINGGGVDFGYTDLYCSPQYGWWLVNGGTVAFGYDDLFGSPTYGWWKIKGGAVDFGYTDLYGSPSCGWWLVEGGTVAFGYNDLFGSPQYGWWKVNGGAVDFGFTDLYCSPSVGWWLVNGGTVAFDYTDLFGSPTYGWWKVNGGCVDFGYTGGYDSPRYGHWNIAGGAVIF